jgi:hypothetical protein
MNHFHIRLTAAAATFVLMTSASWQAMAQPVPAGSSAVQLRIATGKLGKGFSKVLADIRKVCGTAVPMVEVQTEGGLQNLMALAGTRPTSASSRSTPSPPCRTATPTSLHFRR